MRLLVTGATGSLGVPLVRALLAETEHALRLFGRGEPRIAPDGRVEWSPGDVRSAEDVAGAVRGVDAILHLAGLTHSNRASAYREINLGGTRNVAEAAAAAGVSRLIFFSSWAACARGGAYARSKLEAEEAVRGSGGGWVVLRIADVYGPDQGGTLSALLRRVREGRPVPLPGHGRYPVAPLHVDDLVAAVLALLDRPGLARETYTLAGPETLTLNDLVDRAAAFHGLRPRKIHVPLSLIRLAALAALAAGRDRPAVDQIARLRVAKDGDLSAARRDLGFRPRSLEEGLAATFSPDPG